MLFDFENSNSYELDTTQVRRLTIEKFDVNERIVSGTFEFTLVNENDTLKITDGRFDAQYRN